MTTKSTFQMPEKAVVDLENDKQGTFIFKPLEPGYGVTIGNALRRVLLSSIEGYAITSVSFPNVLHEFSMINGVREDVTDIILNLKQVRFKLASEEPVLDIHIKIDNQEAFLAGDLARFTSSFEVLNPDLVICNLEKSITLELDLTIQKGRGYLPAEEQSEDKENPSYGLIPIDAIFTPIKNVEYHVDNTRVEQRTDYEQLRLLVETDGSIHPKAAVHEAASTLIKHLALFSSSKVALDIDFDQATNVVDEDTLRMRKLLKTSLVDLELSVRAYNCLSLAGVKTLMEIVELDVPKMMKFRNFGKKSLTELEQLVSEKGLHFGMDTSPYRTEETS